MNIDFFLLVYGVMIAGVLAVMWIQRRRKGETGKGFFAKMRGGAVNRNWKGNYGGVEYTHEYSSGGENIPSYFRISVACPSKGGFRVVKENAFDVFFKKLGVSKEIQTGDPDFDRDFYILTDAVDFSKAYFSESPRRQAIRRLFASGIAEVRHNGKTLEVKWSPFELKDDTDLTFIEKAAGEMEALAKDMPLFFQRSLNPDSAGVKKKRILCFGVPIFLFIAGGLSAVFGMEFYRPLDWPELFLKSLRYSLPSLILFLWLSFQWLKGRAASHRELLILLSMSVTAYLLSGFGFMTFWNGFADLESPAVFESVPVIEKYKKESDSGTTYYAELGSWRDGKRVERMRVKKEIYLSVVPGKTAMTVSVKPGRLGFEWVESLKPEEKTGRGI
ncbi:MAG TPA: hypothetical protein PKL97_01930 [Candidatus Omnitrophota bacterium]|nr:hypothetical protein [Candidatus Omnitrophota bacterium]